MMSEGHKFFTVLQGMTGNLAVTAPDRYNCLSEPGLLDSTH